MQAIKLIKSGVFIFCSLMLQTIYAQKTGYIKGLVSDKETGETLISAPVYVDKLSNGEITDLDGIFIIKLPEGNYSLTCSYLSYNQQTAHDIVVKNDDTTICNFPLEANTVFLEQVTIVSRADFEKETVLLLERKETSLVLQNIGAQELGRKGVSSVDEGLAQLSSVSFTSMNELFVRGLGDRYNNATLNGLSIPSFNPERKVIALDIFPSAVVRNLRLAKSYSPEFFGDFSGGTVDIKTKGYPEQRFLDISISSAYNSVSSVREFYNSQNSKASRFGFAREQLSLPTEIANTISYSSPVQGGNISFSNSYDSKKNNSFVNSGIKLIGGNKYRLPSGQTLGFLASVTHRNNYNVVQGTEALYNAQQSARYQYNINEYTYTTNTSAMLNVAYDLNNSNYFSFNSLYVNGSNASILKQKGYDNDLGLIYAQRNTYSQNTIWVNQAHGSHKLNETEQVGWDLSYAATIGSTPDRTQNSFQISDEGQYFFSKNSISDNHKFFGGLTENEFSSKIKYSWNFSGKKDLERKLEGGLDGRLKQRNYQSRQIDMRIAINDNIDINNINQVLNPNNLGDGFTDGTFRYVESYYPSNDYNADMQIIAGYAQGSYDLNQKLHLTGGIRMEYSLQSTHYKLSSDAFSKPKRKNQINNLNILPVLSLKYLKSEQTHFILSGSKTLSRPLFAETAPFRYNESFGTNETAGNPLLENSENYNFDLRFEHFPSKSELFSITFFGKYIDRPIERTTVASADVLYTYINTGSAKVAGLEIEVRKNMGEIFNNSFNALKNLSLGINATALYSQISFDKNKAKSIASISPTNTKRPMVGASPYLLNVDLSYKLSQSTKSTTVFTLIYNTFGKRVFVAGSQGAEDIYEMPTNNLDVLIQHSIDKRFQIDLSCKNILNPIHKTIQNFSSPLLINNRYEGIDIGMSIKYKIL